MTLGDASEEERLLAGDDPTANDPPDQGRRSRTFASACVASVGLFVFFAVACVGAGSSGNATVSGGYAAVGAQVVHDVHRLPATGAVPAVDPLMTFNTPACRERRAALARVTHHDGDVVIIPQLRAVYVDVVKAASESIRSALSERFHASWATDVGQYGHPIHGRPSRESTSYLTDDVVANYTFFTFVRDPRTRFRSSYEQAICRERCVLCTLRGEGKMYTPTIPEMASLVTSRLFHLYKDLALMGKRVDDLSLEEAWVDEHFESQVLRLSAATADGAALPINFIGRVENFEHDWAALMDHLGVKQGDDRRQPPRRVEHPCSIKQREEVVRREREKPVTTQENVAVSSLYQDDFECLGYPKPHI